MATRIFLMGAIILFLGAQLRAVDTFVLNEKVTKVVQRRFIEKKAAEQPAVVKATMFDPYLAAPAVQEVTLPKYQRITPPRWLGWSFLSIGAVLVTTCPLFRN